jgi:hypothetical protein
MLTTHEITCSYCVKKLGTVTTNLNKVVAKREFKLMEEHKNSCRVRIYLTEIMLGKHTTLLPM